MNQPNDTPLTLYYAAGSCAMVPRLVLEEAHAGYTLRHVDLGGGEQRTRSFQGLNGLGRVPVLVDGSFVLTENLAILRYLSRRFPGTALWPSEASAEARCLEWLSFGASSLHPAMAHVRRPARYARSSSAQEEVAATGHATVTALLQLTEARLPDTGWAAGPDLSVADLYLLFFWAHGPAANVNPGALDCFPKWSALARRLCARPAISKVLDDERLLVDFRAAPQHVANQASRSGSAR
ncbi:glutathione S-transferase family protein [Chitinasiproducens palmae]|uniref:Glutathione S-transferase n=1 Tax=Chitinasiproducens palmae TaxID=1770053 RepID=A0A1H2PKF0_9BURK|nr:glutathione S-transferase family protein [Chitinasiproducens palmae]SDV46815.1 glutathione S-transferase [Chitinasiproducens palmae]